MAFINLDKDELILLTIINDHNDGNGISIQTIDRKFYDKRLDNGCSFEELYSVKLIPKIKKLEEFGLIIKNGSSNKIAKKGKNYLQGIREEHLLQGSNKEEKTVSRKLIEKQDWQYYLYDLGESYELSVPIANPAPGFDVSYVLNKKEKTAYLTNGIGSLVAKMLDMNNNPSKYKMTPWR